MADFMKNKPKNDVQSAVTPIPYTIKPTIIIHSINGEELVRYVAVDNNNKLIDDCRGYGYTSKHAAEKALWYRFTGGLEQEARENAKLIQNAMNKQHDTMDKPIDPPASDPVKRKGFANMRRKQHDTPEAT